MGNATSRSCAASARARYQRELEEWERQVAAQEAEEAALRYTTAPDGCALVSYWLQQVCVGVLQYLPTEGCGSSGRTPPIAPAPGDQ